MTASDPRAATVPTFSLAWKGASIDGKRAFAAKWADLVFVIYHGLEYGIGEYATFKAFCTAERRMFATTSFTNTGSFIVETQSVAKKQQPGQPVIIKLMPLDHLGAAPVRIEALHRVERRISIVTEFAGSRLETVELEDRPR